MWPISPPRKRLAVFDAAAERLAASVLAGAADAGAAESAPAARSPILRPPGLDSIAVRVPEHPVARDILGALGRPVVAPSANRSGHVSPTTAAHVMDDLGGRIDSIVDGGPAPVGVESTIVACLERADAAAARRPAAREIERVLGRSARRRAASGSDRSADRARHAGIALRAAGAAAPRRDRVEPARRCWPSGRRRRAPSAPSLNLSPRGDLVEAAANLFSHLRTLDADGAKTIAVMPVPHEGLGEAINDRLARAAAPRVG